MSRLIQDLRYTFRTLLKNPGFASIAILTLALGIGANSAIFSVAIGVLLRPLGYRDAERLVLINTQFPTLGFDVFWMSTPEFIELRASNRSLASIGAYNTGQVNIGTVDRPLQVTVGIATADLFTTLGVEAELGRTFTG